MITRPVARWIVFGICTIVMIASFFMTAAEDSPANNTATVCSSKAVNNK
jgi:hypothetical protein